MNKKKNNFEIEIDGNDIWLKQKRKKNLLLGTLLDYDGSTYLWINKNYNKHYFRNYSGYGLNEQVLNMDINYTYIVINQDRDGVKTPYVSSRANWKAKGSRYTNPKIPSETQIILRIADFDKLNHVEKEQKGLFF